MNIAAKVQFIQAHNVQVRFTKAEALVLAQMLNPTAKGSFKVSAGVRKQLEAGVMTKLTEGFKKALKLALKAMLPLLILAPTASGMSISNPNKYADAMEKIAKQAHVEVDVQAKESKSGGTQHVVFKITSPGGSHAMIDFTGSNNLNDLELHNGKGNDPEFDAFVSEWFGTMQERVASEIGN